MTKPIRSHGAFSLRKTGLTQQEIAGRVGVSHVIAGRWAKGEATPGPANRKKLQAKLGIPESAWDEPTQARSAMVGGKSPPSKPPARPREAQAIHVLAPGDDHPASHVAEPPSPRVLALELQHAALEMMRGIRAPGADTTQLERAKLMASLVQTLKRCQDLTGESDIGKKLLKLPVWLRSVAAICAALKPFPDAADACARALEAIDEAG